MEFWGVEVKSGTPLKVKPGHGMVVHLSQASIGEVKANKIETVRLSVNVDGKNMVLGTLMSDKLPQQLFDLVFDKDFELSHNSKSGSIYFFGYKADNPAEQFESDDSEEEEEEDVPVVSNNGEPKIKAKTEVPVVAVNAKKSKDSAAAKQKVQIVEPAKVLKPEDDDSEDDSNYDNSDDSDEDKASAGDLMDEDDDSDSEDEESDEEEDRPPEAVTPLKKRVAQAAIKTPVPEKKAKLATPQKTDGKKSGHVSTPYPSKQAGKTPANTPANKSSQKSPKSGGPHSCGTCKKGFVSELALQSHTKAKHSAGN